MPRQEREKEPRWMCVWPPGTAEKTDRQTEESNTDRATRPVRLASTSISMYRVEDCVEAGVWGGKVKIIEREKWIFWDPSLISCPVVELLLQSCRATRCVAPYCRRRAITYTTTSNVVRCVREWPLLYILSSSSSSSFVWHAAETWCTLCIRGGTKWGEKTLRAYGRRRHRRFFFLQQQQQQQDNWLLVCLMSNCLLVHRCTCCCCTLKPAAKPKKKKTQNKTRWTCQLQSRPCTVNGVMVSS